MRGVKGAISACDHTDRKHYANGLCEPCDKRRRRRADPNFQQRQNELQERRLLAQNETVAGWHRSRNLRRYGMTLADFDRMLAEQSGLCAICGGGPVGPGKRLHVDHDHATGTVRGLLCGNCNTAIGLMADDQRRLLAAADYLAAHEADDRKAV